MGRLATGAFSRADSREAGLYSGLVLFRTSHPRDGKGHNRGVKSERQQVSKRHHTVPQFYLRGFAADNRIATIRLPGEHRFIQSVRDASVSKNFYALEDHPEGSDVIEKALSEIEGAAAAVLEKVQGGTWPLPIEDRMSLGYFISLQATRVPVQRQSFDKAAAMILRLQIGAGGKSGLRKTLEERGQEVTEGLVEQLWAMSTRPEGPPIKRPVAQHLEQMIDLTDDLLKFIVGRPWTLVRFERRSLITSDDPVALVAYPTAEPWEGVGFMTAWGVTYPLTRKLGLLMSSIEPLIDANVAVERVHEGRADMEQTGSTAMERFFNLQTAFGASQWLFHHPEDERYVPDQLPDARPYSFEMSGADREFTGEPWFNASTEG